MLSQNITTQKPITEPSSLSYYIIETGKKDSQSVYKLVLNIGEKEYESTMVYPTK